MKYLRNAPQDLPESLKLVVDYRKSGLSLNHVVGCPLDCGYCVRHLFNNYDMKRPHLVMSDENAVDTLFNHWAFQGGITPIQILNRATDPFLTGVKQHLFSTLEEIDRRGVSNPVLVITRWKVTKTDIERLEALKNVKLTVLVTWSGIDDERIEPVDSNIAVRSLMNLGRYAVRTKKVLYWRPLIAGLNDSAEHIEKARKLSLHVDATVFTGLFHRDEIRQHLREAGVPDLYDIIARRKILPQDVEAKVLQEFGNAPLFRKTSCGVAYAHGIADYNGHFGIKDICDVCPASQLKVCAIAHQKPTKMQVLKLAKRAQLRSNSVKIDGGRIEVDNSTEQQRYFIQHSLNYQVHDVEHPHFPKRHGRADIV
ncbi:MAG: radical SAM protein [Rhizobiaceae bacterium]|nr:radical SAM protein [Rhizobiaceae bacterium]